MEQQDYKTLLERDEVFHKLLERLTPEERELVLKALEDNIFPLLKEIGVLTPLLK